MMETTGNGGAEAQCNLGFCKYSKLLSHSNKNDGFHEVSGIAFTVQSVTATTTVRSFHSGLIPHTTAPLSTLLRLGIFHPYK